MSIIPLSGCDDSDSVHEHYLVKQAESLLNQALELVRLERRVTKLEEQSNQIEKMASDAMAKSELTLNSIYGDNFFFAVPWLKVLGVVVPANYHAQVYKECKALARGYDPELLRKSLNGFPTLRFEEKTLIEWVDRNRPRRDRDHRMDRDHWFRNFKEDLFEAKRSNPINPWPMAAPKSAVEWIKDRFRERREWPLGLLVTLAIRNGLGRDDFYSSEVLSLPIRKTVRINDVNQEEWTWRACRNWP